MKGKTTFLARASMMLLAVLLSLTGARAQAKDLPYEYGFENNDLAAEGWTMENCYASTGISSNAKRTGNYAFRFYYRSNPPQYLISPEFEGTTAMTVSFWYRPGSSSYPEKFQFGYSSTTNATDAFTWEEEVTATNSSEWIQYETNVPAGTKYVAIMLNSDDKYYLYLDDFVFSVPSSATKPETLVVSGITDSEAVLTWTGGDGTYNVEYKKASETDWTVAATGTTEYTCTLSGLTSGTAYEARVQSVNGSDVSSWKTVSFSTVIGFPYFQDFAAGLPTDWTIYTGLVEEVLSGAATLTALAAKWKVGTDNGVLDGNHALANIYSTSTQHWLVTPAIPVEANAQLAFDVAYTAYDGTAVAPNATGTDDKFVVLISTDEKATWTILRQWDNAGSEFVLNDLGPTKTSVSIDLSAYAGQNVCVAFYVESTESNTDNNLHIDNVSIDLKPAIETPYGLKISYDGGTEATVSWASIEDAWDIDVNGVVTEDVDNPFTLTGLEYATTYTIKVRAKKGIEVSSWSAPVTFSTVVSDDMCQIQLLAMDEYGDGWGGSNITITDVESGIVIGTYTLTSDAGQEVQTFVIDVPNNRDIQFTWTSNSSWDSEASYAAYDINEVEIFSGSGGFATPITWQVDCKVIPWRAPSDLAASEITATSVKLSWTENSTTPATSWVVSYIAAGETDATEVVVGEIPYVLEGLTAETTYTVKVRPETDEVEKWSDEISFTTAEAFTRPADVAAEPTATTAEVTWTGEADSYNLRYREFASTGGVLTESFEEGLGEWTTIDADGDGLGWILGSTVGGVYLKEGGSLAGAGNGGSADLVTSGSYSNLSGALNPDNYLVSPRVTLGGTITFYACAQDASYSAEHFGVAVSTTSNSNPAAFTMVEEWTMNSDGTGSKSSRRKAQGTWGLFTVDLSAYAGQEGYVAIRHFNCTDQFLLNVDDITISQPSAEEKPWTEVANATSPYTIEGLTPETKYEVEVQAVYAEGESYWKGTTFTTLELVPAPTALAAEASSRAAELSWTENGEATSWQICLNDDETKPIEANENPFTVTGLTPETEYTAKVRAYNKELEAYSKWSAAVTFTTDIAFPAPEDLAVEPTATTAEVTWEGDPAATSFELQWAELPALTDAAWYNYDNGTFTSNVGLGGGEFSWGVMFPAGTYTGNALSKVSVFDPEDITMTGTVTIYNDDATNAPTDAIATKPVTFTGAGEFIEISFENLELDATKNVWVIFYNESGTDYPAAASADEAGDANGRWVEIGGTWYDMANVGVTGKSFMIRAEIGTAEAEPVWTTVANATSPTELEGLTPETTYVVKVKATYGEGESEWATTSFTTTEANPIPSNIVADLVADGATLTWEGSGDSYKVRYRTAEDIECYFFDDFSQGLYQWTLLCNGDEGPYASDDYPGFIPTGESALSYSYDNSTGNAIAADNWLISPVVDLKGILDFYTYSGDGDEYEVLLSTTGNAPEDFTTVLKEMGANASTDEWTECTFNLSNYAGQKGYIAIHHVFTDGYYLDVASFGIYGENYTPAGEWTEIAVEDATAVISGLATNNGYEYQVQSIKGGVASEWSDTQEFALLTLDSYADNNSLLNNNSGRQAHVTLTNRTLKAGGAWNTLVLPFDLSQEEVAASALAGADARFLEGITVNSETSVTMNFSAQGAYDKYGLVGGYPWLVKWDTGSDIVNPAFANVTITSQRYELAYEDATGYGVTFNPTYELVNFTEDDPTKAFVGDENKIYYPLAGAKVGAFRGYFTLKGFDLSESNGVKIFTNLDDDDATGIVNVETIDNSDWYDLSGRKLAGKPSMKGIYVNGGRKVTVK